MPLISFPNGNFDREVLEIAKECGYKAMLTASIYAPESKWQEQLIYRIGINEITSGLALLKRIFVARKEGKFLSSDRAFLKNC